MSKYVMAIDQGTTSTRAMLFNHAGEVLGARQKGHEQYFPKPGWVEHDPLEIWSATQFVVQSVLNERGITKSDLAAVGFWKDQDALRQNWKMEKTRHPNMDESLRSTRNRGWKKAVARTFDWVE